jgi:23S rRNA (cytosine1962-C5)-methyltransferase
MTYPILTIKPELEVHLKNRHHAIYQSAVRTAPDCLPGSIVEVQAHDGAFLCYATYNPRSYICGRAIGFKQEEPLKQLRENIEKSVALRRKFFTGEDSDSFRLINAEGDGIPGLIVDEYNGILVVQLTTLGMEKLRDWIADVLMEVVNPKAIFEKSTGSARKKEGLDGREGWLRGEADETVIITERGLKYKIALAGSQKTGFFLDQREMRSLVRQHAKGRTILDVCSYVGGFSVSAFAGGALAADAVDYDDVALERAKEHVALNGFDTENFSSYTQDAFDFLRRPSARPYDFIILDPPAFAKRSDELDLAKKAYTDMNRMAMEKLPSGGLLLTCSCSFQIDPVIFQTIVFHAAWQAKRNVRIIQRHRQAYDHPVNIYHPETDYLKSLLLWID